MLAHATFLSMLFQFGPRSGERKPEEGYERMSCRPKGSMTRKLKVLTPSVSFSVGLQKNRWHRSQGRANPLVVARGSILNHDAAGSVWPTIVTSFLMVEPPEFRGVG